jgi:hypothetical protein
MNKTTANERFGAMAALPRRQFCGNLHVITPRKVQWKPPLRQAAGTLYVSCEQPSSSAILKRKKTSKLEKFVRKIFSSFFR